MRPDAFLSLAEWLLVNKKTPEGFRSVTSRAYYASFHTALLLLADMNITVPGSANKHEKVPDILNHTNDSSMEIAGTKLNSLRAERNRAYYLLNDTAAGTEKYAQLRLNDAKEIIAALNTCRLSKKRIAKAKVEAVKRANFLFLGK